MRRTAFAARTMVRGRTVIGRVYLERGRPVVVLLQWAGPGPRNVLVEREDGTKVVRPFRGLRLAGRGLAPPAGAG